jgi:hypothetical protein
MVFQYCCTSAYGWFTDNTDKEVARAQESVHSK